MSDIDADDLATAPGSGDIDLTDETQDFRFLTSLSSATEHSSLPRRGEKDFEPHGTTLQQDMLAASRAAMHHALSYPRVHAPKTNITGIYNPSTGLTIIENQKGQHFRTMGKADVTGRIHLLPEETLYILERGNLELRWLPHSSDLSLNMAISLQSAYTELLDQDGLTLERYTVYADLKRSGYIVQRGLAWHPENCEMDRAQTRSSFTPRSSPLLAWLHQLLFETRPKPPPIGPLVNLGLYRSYLDIYRFLDLIPFHNATLTTERELSTTPHPEAPMATTRQHIQHLRPSFYVWKPRPDFKKSTPGPADFTIVVINAREDNVPTLQQLAYVLQSVPFNPPPTTMDNQVYQKLKHGWRGVILAVVDQGVVSYVNISDTSFGTEKLYDHTNRGRGGKRGSGAKGRGRGRRGGGQR
ncbi:MAG: hypothetical protein Q9187_003121 [Circinaria calcarea]